jgi:hypothetical protein
VGRKPSENHLFSCSFTGQSWVFQSWVTGWESMDWWGTARDYKEVSYLTPRAVDEANGAISWDMGPYAPSLEDSKDLAL